MTYIKINSTLYGITTAEVEKMFFEFCEKLN